MTDSTPDGFASLLSAERTKWAAFGILPSPQTLALLLDRLDGTALATCDEAFLIASLALALGSEFEDEQDEANLELALGDLLERAGEETESVAPVLPVSGFAMILAMTRLGRVLHVGNLVTSVDRHRTLYVLLIGAGQPTFEAVVIAGGYCGVRRLTNGADAREAVLGWSKLVDQT